MSGSSDLLSTAVSGLVAFQRGLATTGHNISNVNTAGYSRQSIDLATRPPNLQGGGFVGTGVSVTAIKRIYDSFLYEQVLSRNSSFNSQETLFNLASRVDNLLGADEAGLDGAVQMFFDSLQDVSNNPTSIPAREVLLSNGETLVQRFATLSDQFEDMKTLVNDQLTVLTDEVSSIAQRIADLNNSIAIQTGLSGGQPPNDLLDLRDIQLNRLSEIVDVRVVDADDGSINVFVGSGQTLVLGANASAFGITRNSFDQSQLEVSFDSSTTSFSISEQITGGVLGGLLEFRNDVLNIAQNEMGRIAIGLTDVINSQHQLGDDLNGNAGGLFFNNIIASSPVVQPNVNNNPLSGTVSVSISDSAALYASDYRLNYDGANFTVVRIRDNVVVDSGFSTAALPRTIASDGITISLAGTVAAGDSFLLRPVYNGGEDIAMQLNDPFAFAAAASGGALGDNRNALAMMATQHQRILGNGTETFQSAYGKMIASVGVRTSDAEVNAKAQKALLNRAVANHQEVSGVNLDEEAANLLKFQQAYQAAARVITVADEVFQSLLNATS